MARFFVMTVLVGLVLGLVACETMRQAGLAAEPQLGARPERGNGGGGNGGSGGGSGGM
jgi:hypothetical protein